MADIKEGISGNLDHDSIRSEGHVETWFFWPSANQSVLAKGSFPQEEGDPRVKNQVSM